ncbi:hypothetical protein [[Mycobacterium] nativiensis]|uniref:PE-PGRS family protein n=1 Tax=[Mycobacterium] nativiensis TaxID=2855503 RepID=A0ABU5XZL1_9MYCO|nr:hypothetical protein [Mycolicibacter sp. MYC340]MEB3033436.1 hypothetical protein [Mycolicibacter sp. MYC340]
MGEDSSTANGKATGGTGGTGADGNVYAGNPDAPGSSPSADNATVTGGSGGKGTGSGIAGGNGAEGNVVSLGDENSDGQTSTGADGANKP